MKIAKKSSLVAGAVVVAVTVGSFGVAEAATPSKSSKVGVNVAVSKPTIARAMAGAHPLKTVLDGLVSKATITQAQEDAILAAVAAAKPADGKDQPGAGGGHDGEMGAMHDANKAAELYCLCASNS